MVALISILFVVASMIGLTLNTMPSLQGRDADNNLVDNEHLVHLEAACIGWFTLEYVLRLWAAPSKCQFFKVLPVSVVVFYFSFLVVGVRNLS